MPFTARSGIRIHYEVHGAGFPLVLLHGRTEIIRTADGFEQAGTTAIAAELESHGHPRWAALVRQADSGAMAARTRTLLRMPPMQNRLREVARPLLLIWGALEKPPALPLPPHAQTLVVAGEDHIGAFLRTDVTVPGISRFLRASGAPSSTR